MVCACLHLQDKGRDIQLSKALSYFLRHGPNRGGPQLMNGNIYSDVSQKSAQLVDQNFLNTCVKHMMYDFLYFRNANDNTFHFICCRLSTNIMPCTLYA